MSWGHLFLDIFDDVEFSIDMEYAPNNSLKYSSEKADQVPINHPGHESSVINQAIALLIF